MAITKYSYSISTGTANSLLASDALSIEIAESSIIIALDHIDTAGDDLDIWMKDALNASDQTTLTQIVNVHTGVSLKPFSQTVVIKEENDNATGGHYQSQSFELIVDQAVNTEKTLDISFPFPISLFSAKWINETLFKGDEVKVLLAPDTIIGAISANVSTSDIVIPVQQSVIDNTYIGCKIKIDDGTNSDDCGKVLSIDNITKTITVETPTVNSFLSATPAYIKQTIELVPKIYLKGSYITTLGEDVIGGSHIPANAIIRAVYKNNEGTTVGKIWSVVLEYKY